MNAEDHFWAGLTSRRMNALIGSNKCSPWECVHRHIRCSDTNECHVFWRRMYDAFYRWIDAMRQFNVSNTEYRNYIYLLNFETISHKITLWWDPPQSRSNKGRFKITSPTGLTHRDEDSETVYDYHARVVSAIILELTRTNQQIYLRIYCPYVFTYGPPDIVWTQNRITNCCKILNKR